jgi:hypothetical protein
VLNHVQSTDVVADGVLKQRQVEVVENGVDRVDSGASLGHDAGSSAEIGSQQSLVHLVGQVRSGVVHLGELGVNGAVHLLGERNGLSQQLQSHVLVGVDGVSGSLQSLLLELGSEGGGLEDGEDVDHVGDGKGLGTKLVLLLQELESQLSRQLSEQLDGSLGEDGGIEVVAESGLGNGGNSSLGLVDRKVDGVGDSQQTGGGIKHLGGGAQQQVHDVSNNVLGVGTLLGHLVSQQVLGGSHGDLLLTQLGEELGLGSVALLDSLWGTTSCNNYLKISSQKSPTLASCS